MPLPVNINTPTPGASTIVYIQLYDPSIDGPQAGSAQVGPINCTNRMHIRVPGEKTQHVRCGLNPSAYVIPAIGQPGEFEMNALDFTNYDQLRQFNGMRVIATLVTSSQGVTIWTEVLSDWNPTIERDIPEGDGVTTLSARGVFKYMVFINSNGASSSYYDIGTAGGYPPTT
jgi:hypothetical protein